jgi:hypothetical protein
MNFIGDAAADGAKHLLFGSLDFILFTLMPVLSTLTGMYFGSWGKMEITPKEYLHGGKSEYYSGSSVSCGQASTVTKVKLEALNLFLSNLRRKICNVMYA